MLKVEVKRCGQLFDLMAVHIPVGNKGSPKDENGLRKQKQPISSNFCTSPQEVNKYYLLLRLAQRRSREFCPSSIRRSVPSKRRELSTTRRNVIYSKACLVHFSLSVTNKLRKQPECSAQLASMAASPDDFALVPSMFAIFLKYHLNVIYLPTYPTKNRRRVESEPAGLLELQISHKYRFLFKVICHWRTTYITLHYTTPHTTKFGQPEYSVSQQNFVFSPNL